MKQFNIGDTVHYMELNVPQSKVIVGKATLEGEVKTTGLSIMSSEKCESTKVVLFTGSYNCVDSKNCFSSLEELKESLFPTDKIKNEIRADNS